MQLSVVIPAYNEETRITLTILRTVTFLRARHPDSEVLVVDDGSTDDTAAMVEFIGRTEPMVKLLRQPDNRGKGAAVRRGMLEAGGERILFMDADLATPVEEISKVLLYADRGYDVVIGSRGLDDKSDVLRRQPILREMMGRTFNKIVQRLAFSGIKDTQCGFKLFSREAARSLFSRQSIDGFAFDVEILLLARESGYRIREVPIVWSHAPHSKVSPLWDASRMLWDVIRLHRRRDRRP